MPKLINMRKVKLTHTVFMMGIVLSIFTACNNSGETKETVTDSTTIKMDNTTVPPAPVIVDTMKMDTATTRPVKNPD